MKDEEIMRSGRWIAIALALCACFILAVAAPAQEKPPIKLGAIFIMSEPMGGYGTARRSVNTDGDG